MEIGDIVRGREVSIDPSKLLQGKNIVGSLMYRAELLPRLLNFLVRNKDRAALREIVSHKFPLADVNEAFPKQNGNSASRTSRGPCWCHRGYSDCHHAKNMIRSFRDRDTERFFYGGAVPAFREFVAQARRHL